MSKKISDTHARTEATTRLRETNPEKFAQLQAKCMDTFEKQMQKTVESVQTARFRFIGEWWNYWYYELWRIDPTSNRKSGFPSIQDALDTYGMNKKSFYNYVNEATAILNAVHDGAIPDDAIFNGELAIWAYNASKQAKLSSSHGEIKLLPLLTETEDGEAPRLPSIVGDNLRQYYIDKKIAREAKRAKRVEEKAEVSARSEGSIRNALNKLEEGAEGMRLIWKQRGSLKAAEKKELEYLYRMIVLIKGADDYDVTSALDHGLKFISYKHALKHASTNGNDALKKTNRFAYEALGLKEVDDGEG
jgi:hypothetical protein